MSRPVIVLDEAEEELFAAEDWYEEQRRGLGLEFRAAVDEAMDRLTEAPRSASPVLTVPDAVGARRVFVKCFPYAIIFVEANDDLWVLAFAHHRRKPGYWRHRRGRVPS